MSSHVVASNTEAAILARVIEADPHAITPEVAATCSPCGFLPPTRIASMSFRPRPGPAL